MEFTPAHRGSFHEIDIFVLMSEFLDQDIQFLPGVGPVRAELLRKELNIETFRDLLYYFPYKYIDRTRFYRISEVEANMSYVQVKGRITSFETVGTGSRQRLAAIFRDETGTIELIWFQGIKWMKEHLEKEKVYTIFGKPSEFNGRISIVHPEIEAEGEISLAPSGIFQAHYNTTENLKKKFLNSKAIHKLVLTLLGKAEGKISETLPPWLTGKWKLMSLEKALVVIHKPENMHDLGNARYRLKYEELFF